MPCSFLEACGRIRCTSESVHFLFGHVFKVHSPVNEVSFLWKSLCGNDWLTLHVP
jgi:hypothetical protein